MQPGQCWICIYAFVSVGNREELQKCKQIGNIFAKNIILGYSTLATGNILNVNIRRLRNTLQGKGKIRSEVSKEFSKLKLQVTVQVSLWFTLTINRGWG